MLILIDYDNVQKLEQRKGLEHIVSKVTNLIGPLAIAKAPRIRVRLYGGWYENTGLTRVAQDLVVQIQGRFPQRVTVANGAQSASSIVNAELATALEVEPSVDLVHTYRPRGSPTGLVASHFPFTGCADTANCGLASIHTFLAQGTCPASGCGVDMTGVLYRAEQKLVDTMMTADLIIAASRGTTVTLVSSDDDMWPAIRTALAVGGTVMHVHTKPIRATIRYYAPPISGQYTSFQL